MAQLTTLKTLHAQLTNLHAFDITALQVEMAERMRIIEKARPDVGEFKEWQELKEMVGYERKPERKPEPKKQKRHPLRPNN